MSRFVPGALLQGRYRIDEELGGGDSTTTFRALDVQTERNVVIKRLLLRQLGDWKVFDLFEREARILRNLRHPAVPRYLDSFSEEQGEDVSLVLVQEHIEGQDLARLLESGRRFPEQELVGFGLQLLQVLMHLHGLNPPVVHRDIKPSNVILRGNGALALVDFGAAAGAARSRGAGGSTVVGTYGYMPPEQFMGKVEPATDLYGLGCTLVHLATGTHPSQLPMRRMKVDFREQASLAEDLAAFLDRLVEPDLELRIGRAEEALAELRRVAIRRHGARLGGRRARPLRVHPVRSNLPVPGSSDRAPFGSDIAVRRPNPDTLELVLPGNISMKQLGRAGFGAFWLCVIAAWTWSAAHGSLLLTAFSLPFWAVGLGLIVSTVFRMFGRYEVRLDASGLEVHRTIGGVGFRQRAPVNELREARVVNSRNLVSIVSRRGHLGEDRSKVVRVPAGARNLDLGAGLSETELSWVAQVVNEHVAKLQQRQLPPSSFSEGSSARGE